MKNKKPLIIGAIILLLVAIGIGSYFVINQTFTTGKDAAGPTCRLESGFCRWHAYPGLADDFIVTLDGKKIRNGSTTPIREITCPSDFTPPAGLHCYQVEFTHPPNASHSCKVDLIEVMDGQEVVCATNDAKCAPGITPTETIPKTTITTTPTPSTSITPTGPITTTTTLTSTPTPSKSTTPTPSGGASITPTGPTATPPAGASLTPTPSGGSGTGGGSGSSLLTTPTSIIIVQATNTPGPSSTNTPQITSSQSNATPTTSSGSSSQPSLPQAGNIIPSLAVYAFAIIVILLGLVL